MDFKAFLKFSGVPVTLKRDGNLIYDGLAQIDNGKDSSSKTILFPPDIAVIVGDEITEPTGVVYYVHEVDPQYFQGKVHRFDVVCSKSKISPETNNDPQPTIVYNIGDVTGSIIGSHNSGNINQTTISNDLDALRELILSKQLADEVALIKMIEDISNKPDEVKKIGKFKKLIKDNIWIVESLAPVVLKILLNIE